MIVAHDIYSETNPAFCAYALVAFVNAYISISAEAPEVPTVYLALPVALSSDLEETFKGTNKKTSLLEWLERSPQVQIGLAERLNASLGIVSEAIRFACFTRVLTLDEFGRLGLGDLKLKKNAVKALSEKPARVIKRAERLGYWFATVRSTRSVFDIVGLTV